jgi:predicted metal-dependent peptidase
MTADYTEAQRAEGKIGIAIQRLVDKYVFHCRILEQFQLRERPAVGTLAVTVAGDRIELLYNAAFVLNTPMAQLAGVLLHEVHHVVFGHLFADPEEHPDRWARLVAAEVTANEFVKEPLPEGAILLKGFPQLAPLQSTNERYAILKDVKTRRQIAGPAGQPPGKGRGSGGSTLDDHAVWEEGQDRAKVKATVECVVQDVVLAVGMDRVPEGLKDALRSMGVGQYDLCGDRRGHLDWRRLLRRYVGQILDRRTAYNRPSRRFPALVGIMPGKCRQAARARVMAVIDTSGSVTPDLLEMINAELAQLAKHYAVLVVECDTKVHKVYDYDAPLKAVHGRGGTDFRPPLAREFLRKRRPDLIVYFTDGRGPAPEQAPRIPLVWCLVPGGQRPAGWGRLIHMDGKSGR